MIPGEITGPDGNIELNIGRPRLELDVVNGGDRPVQVGSHYHFAEANPALLFDRAAARSSIGRLGNRAGRGEDPKSATDRLLLARRRCRQGPIGAVG